MAKILIVYYSRSGNTKEMAQHVENGIKEVYVYSTMSANYFLKG